MGCIFRPRINSISSVWYTILVICLNAYMMNLGLRRYKLYTEIKWPHGAYPHFWLTVYVSLYGACFPLCVLLFAFGVFKSGNLAGDHEIITARYERTLETTKSTKKSCCLRFLKTTWMHCPPLPQTIHIILALCQMVAHQVMLAQLYRFGYINSGEFLNTELDFIFTRTRQLVSNLPMGDTRLQAFKLSTDELNTAPLSPRILPVLMHARLFGIHLETLNFIIAILCFACAYPSVFSRISKYFSFFFSIHLIFFAVDLFFTYIEFSILFRIQETNKYSVRPIGLGQYLPGRFFPKILFDPLVILGLFVATVAVSLTGPTIIYYYGYQQYQIFLKNFLAKSKRQMRNNSKEYGPLHADDDIGPNICCNGYGPNALATFYLIILALLKAPAIGGFLEIYDKEPKLLLLTSILISASYLFFWLLFWLALTCKSSWNLRVLYNVQEIVNLQGAHKFEATHGKSPTELKDALVMVFEDRMYVTDDALARQSLIRHAMKTTHDEVYWTRGNSSPTEKRVVIDDGRDPESVRLIDARLQNPGNQMTGSTPPSAGLSYNQARSLRGLPPHPPHAMTDERFATFQRPVYGSGMLNHQTATLGRHSTSNLRHPETYASINRSLHHGDLNYAGFNNGPPDLNNGHYASYSRMPISRPQPQSILSQGIYGSRQTSEPVDGMNPPSSLSIQGSPMMQPEEMKSHYQRTSGLSSFNNGSRMNSVPRLLPTGQSNFNKQTISASSSQQDSCLTPTSTTTNNGSINTSMKQATPTAGSPSTQNGVRINGFPAYGRNNMERGGSEPHQTGNYGTLTKSSASVGSAPRMTSGPIRMPIKSTTVSITQHHDDSANFSLSSSNESDGHCRKINSNINDPEYATSVV